MTCFNVNVNFLKTNLILLFVLKLSCLTNKLTVGCMMSGLEWIGTL